MAAEGVGEHRAEGLVVDVAGAFVGGAGEAQVALEGLLVAQRQQVHGAEIVLLVEVVELAVVVAGAEAVVPLVGGAGEVERVAGGAGADDDAAGAAVGEGHVLVVGGVALVDLLELAGVEGQAVELQGIQVAALEGLRQQARVVVLDHRQLGQQGADLEHALGGAQLGGEAELAVFVLGAAGFAVALEQAGAGAVGAGVELDAEQAEGIDAHPHGALGEAGLIAQEEALGPFLGLGLGGIVLAEVAIEVEVAQFQAGLAVLDELGLGDARQNDTGAKRGQGHGLGERGLAHCYCLLVGCRSVGSSCYNEVTKAFRYKLCS
ncbi:hypothetical protein D3C78_503220 [compost metagenome]